MIKYVVYWDGTEIARIYKKDSKEEKYKYVPNCTEMEGTSAPMEKLGAHQSVWGSLPKFFADRIAKDPNCKNGCKCDNDKLTIKMVNP